MTLFKTENTSIVTSDNIHLSGIVTIPTGKPTGLALILQGSGNVASDGDVSGPFLGSPYKGGSGKLSIQIAESLAQEGIASLRYSKRGFEDSNQLPNQTIPYIKSDAVAAMNLLKARFESLPFFLVGHSEGAVISSLIAIEHSVNGLFLLGIPTRPIDEVLRTQFTEWPIRLLADQLDKDHDGNLSASDFANLPLLPLWGADWKTLDKDQNGVVSIEHDIKPFYFEQYKVVEQILQSPDYAGWLQSMKELPPFKEIAKKINRPVFLYQGKKDAQVYWNCVKDDALHFASNPVIRYYEDLGHCFSPMDGTIGEVKTTGPMDLQLLNQLRQDIRSLL